MNKTWLLYMAIPLFVVIMMLTGCSRFEDQLNCHPIKSTECVGWLGDKPIYIEEEL
jgi:hypothetical protein